METEAQEKKLIVSPFVTHKQLICETKTRNRINIKWSERIERLLSQTDCLFLSHNVHYRNKEKTQHYVVQV
jgi:hypothetical protein